jgi:hypothetical protein
MNLKIVKEATNEINRARRVHIDYSRWHTRRKRNANKMTLKKNRNARRVTENDRKLMRIDRQGARGKSAGERAELCI